MNKSEHKKKAMLNALEKTLGVVTTACKEVDISRTTFYNWLANDEAFAEAVNEVSEVSIDFAESQLFKQMKSGNVAATIFYLKTKGRARGYAEQATQNDEITLHDQW